MRLISKIMLMIAVALMPFSSCTRPDKVWRGLKTGLEVESFLIKELPPGSTAEETVRFFEGYQLPCSGLTEGKVYASAPAGQVGFFIERRWLMVFQFDADGVMTGFEVRAGLTGP